MPSTAATTPARVRLPISFDVESLRRDAQALGLHGFVHDQVIPLTAPVPLRTDVVDDVDGQGRPGPPTE